ncbi:phosphate propanoyltransferase [Chryseomicrobium palamuruense]|uniref:Phosphate propanoyltransferase n=1 Tax=Chryseomicrobium palamuruense TaxID=682973 RepID=A0ABV8UW18_9BACL
MSMDPQLIQTIVREVLASLEADTQQTPDSSVPIAISARHVHLSEEHIEQLFGKGYQLTKRADLSQPGQFAAEETVHIAGPKGSFTRVRVLGPARKLTQVEVSQTDTITLGVSAPVRESGDIAGSAGVTLIGPKGSLYLNEGLIVAQAHIHMSPQDAARYQVQDQEYVEVLIDSDRPLRFQRVKVRVSDRYRLEMHIDTDEANAAFLQKKGRGQLIKAGEVVPQQIALEQTQVKQVSSERITYTKKLLTKEDVESLQGKEVRLPKGTIVTDLAKDFARERGIALSFETGK